MPVSAFVASGPVVRDRGVTVILVAHLMEETEELCDRVAVVDGGRVVALDRLADWPANWAAGVFGRRVPPLTGHALRN